MKICVCGKGGSGKSTIVSLMADAFRKNGKKVTVLDSDESNLSLFWMLGFEKGPVPLMESLGGKRKVQEKMIARFSKGDEEAEMSIWEGDRIPRGSLPSQYVVEKEGLSLITVGKIYQAMEGCACPMGVVAREFLKKIELGPDEVMVVDMDAGIEHFGRGIEASVDAVVCVVEPSLESILLAKKVMELARSAGSAFYGAILNKMASKEQENQVVERLNANGVPFIGSIGFQNALQDACLTGKPLSDVTRSLNLSGIVDTLLQKQENGKKV